MTISGNAGGHHGDLFRGAGPVATVEVLAAALVLDEASDGDGSAGTGIEA